MTGRPAFERFRALGCLCVVGVVDADRRTTAMASVASEIDACDRACSRFRDDSELARLNRTGFVTDASQWLCSAITTALAAAATTDGLVDPTIGQTLIDLGYDRTFDAIEASRPFIVTAAHVPAWTSVSVDAGAGRVRMPRRVQLDLGATAKALCADRAARRAAQAAGTGVLVSLGGDIAVSGPAPDEGWIIRVTDTADTEPGDRGEGQTVSIVSGGLATSGTTARRWTRAGTAVHHLIDPRTGGSAEEVWRTVSVAAPSCVEANTASTAAVILGAAAERWLAGRGCDARLVGADGRVTTTGGWPADPLATDPLVTDQPATGAVTA